MKAAVCLLLLVAVVARAQNGGGELHYEQAAYSDNAAADVQSLDQLPFDADNADSEMPMQEQEQEQDQYDQEAEGEGEMNEDESDEMAGGASLAEVDSDSSDDGIFDDLKVKAKAQLTEFKKHPVKTLSNLAHKVSDGINAIKKAVNARRSAKPAPTPAPVAAPPRVTPIRRPAPAVGSPSSRRPARRPARRPSKKPRRPTRGPRPVPQPIAQRPRPRPRPALRQPIISAAARPRPAGRRPSPAVRRPARKAGGGGRAGGGGGRRPAPPSRSRPSPHKVGGGRPRGRGRGRGRAVRGFPRAPPAAARAAGGNVDTLWHSERHDFGPKNADRDPEMAKLNLALEAVKEDILSTNKQINDERRWVIAVSKIITSYNTKMKRVETHIVTLRKEMKQLYKKKKQIENLKLQRLLEAKLKEARDELATLTNSLKHVATKQSELNKSGADLRMTIAGIQAQLAKLRGQQMMKKCKRGFKFSKKAKKCVSRCKKGMKWKGNKGKGKKGKGKGKCVPKKGKGKGKGKKGKAAAKPKKF